MKVFLDTNVLVAACVADHEHHSRALPLLQSIHDGANKGFVSGHSLLETHSVLTRLPRAPHISPVQAAALIRANILDHFSVVTLTGREYGELAERLGRESIAGGRCYDLLHLACAAKSGAERIYTFNVRDFAVLAGRLAHQVAAP